MALIWHEEDISNFKYFINLYDNIRKIFEELKSPIRNNNIWLEYFKKIYESRKENCRNDGQFQCPHCHEKVICDTVKGKN